MFSSLRNGAPISVLNKNEIEVEIGEVVSVSQPTPQYNLAYQNGMVQQPKMLVDVRAKIGDQTVDFQKLPSDQSIADCNGMVVSESKDAIVNEVAAMEKISQSILSSMDRHNEIVGKCHSLLEELNPERKREAERVREITDLKSEVGELKSMLAKLLNNKTE